MNEVVKGELALLVLPSKIEERTFGQVLSMATGSIALEIKEPLVDVELFFKAIIGQMVAKKTGLSVEIPEMNREKKGKIAYKLLCSHVRTDGIRLSGNIRREVGNWCASAGISTDEGTELIAEIVKDTFFSKYAD